MYRQSLRAIYVESKALLERAKTGGNFAQSIL